MGGWGHRDITTISFVDHRVLFIRDLGCVLFLIFATSLPGGREHTVQWSADRMMGKKIFFE